MIKRPYFFKKSNALIGLEFTAHSIQWAELSHNKKSYHLESYAQIPINIQNPLYPSEQEQTEIAHTLKQSIAELNPQTCQACISIDYSSVLFKTGELDKNLSAEEIQHYLQHQAEKHFNFPPNELMLDFNILGSSSTNQGLVKIQWVAAKRRDLSPWLHIVTQAKLKPAIVDINSCALQRATIFSLNKEIDAKAVIATIHLYQQSFLLIIFNTDTQFLVRHEKFAVDTPALECITHCLRLNAWRHEQPISQILLSGNLIDYKSLEEKTGIKTLILSPFPKIPTCHQYAVSIGLALRIQP